MKEPWQVFDDELRVEIGRLQKIEAGPDGPVGKVAEQDVGAISRAVVDATANHLIEAEGLSKKEAMDVTRLFLREAGREGETDVPLRERLRHAWTNWRLDQG